MPDLLMFVGGGKESICALGKAKSLGYDLAIMDGNVNSVGLQWAKKHKARWNIASSYDYKAVAELAKQYEPDGVVAVGADVGPTVSYVARHVGLKQAIPFSISSLSWNKKKLKTALTKRGSGIPMAKFPNRLRYNDYVVVKPVDGRGSRGVFRVPFKEVDKYVELAKPFSAIGEVIIEEWIDGPQVSTESVVWNGVVTFTGMTDRLYYDLDRLAPYVIENGGVGPSRYEGTSTGIKIRDLVRRIVAILGIENGTIKCDIVLNIKANDEPTLIECAIGRMSGGYTCSHYIPLAYGYDFLAAAFDVACDRPPYEYNIIRRPKFHVCGIYDIPGTAQNMKDRGTFFMAISDTREHAILKAKDVSNGRFTHSPDGKMWERTLSQ